MPSFDILTIGSATQDVFVRSKDWEEENDPYAPSGIEACLPMGAKLNVQELYIGSGGGATNAAATFGSLGLKVAAVSRVGKDPIADFVRADIKRFNVDTTCFQIDKKLLTGYSIILLSKAGHRSILSYRGASNFMKASEFCWKKKSIKTKWLYLSSFGGKTELLKPVFDFAKKQNARVAWNPGSKELESNMRTLKTFIKQTDVFQINREEAALLTHLPPRDTAGLLKSVGAMVKDTFILTDGKHGAYIKRRKEDFFVGTLPGKRVNTTGAGDAFCSGYVSGLILKDDTDTAIRYAALNSDGVVKAMGAKAGILAKPPSKAMMNKVKITKRP